MQKQTGREFHRLRGSSMKLIRRCPRILILSLLSVSVFAPIVFFSHRLKHLSHFGREEFVEDLSNIKHRADAALRLNAVEQVLGEEFKEPRHVVYEDQDLVSVVTYNSNENDDSQESENINAGDATKILERNENNDDRKGSQQYHQSKMPSMDGEKVWLEGDSNQSTVVHDRDARPQYWRITNEDIKEIKEGNYHQTTVRHENVHFRSRKVTDERVTEMKDQVIRAKVYLNFAPPGSNSHIVRELRQRIREVERAVDQATKDSNLSRSSLQKMKYMEATLSKASRIYPDCSAMVTKLRTMTHNTEELLQLQRNQATYLVRLAARTTPKGLHCLSMRLTAEYFAMQPGERKLPIQQKLQDTELYHFAVFSDNVLACAVVVNSTISTAMESEKIVFHVVTDSLNLPAISKWFLLNPPGKATIQIQSIDNFEWLSTKYNMTLKKQNSSDPRYTSELNHLRFYLPDIFPALDKIVLFDHDVVVQRDLTALWSVDMKGKVNGAVETCHDSKTILRMDMLINFSDPLVEKRFDANARTWAFGMNLFDLREWRRQNLTAVYHKYLQLAYEMQLLKAGSLPLGWLTFYNQTVALDWQWHVLGLGYDSDVAHGDVEQAAVIHYDGVMKPWLDISIARYKGYWSLHVPYDHPYLQQCNIHG